LAAVIRQGFDTMAAEVNNAFDVAFFFADTALAENEYLQPQKLQGLLFLSQAYFAVAFEGRKLMPAVFVADERRPLEPKRLHGVFQGTAHSRC